MLTYMVLLKNLTAITMYIKTSDFKMNLNENNMVKQRISVFF